MRGLAGAFERSWSGEPGSVPWTRALLPLAAAYGALSARARRSARDARRRLPGCRVIAIGNLTVGGTGKTTIARWLAEETVRSGERPAILLRGHGAGELHPGVVPDLEGYPLEARAPWYGDEAVALRRALPREAVVAADPDRYRAGKAACSGYGARVLILDDGWEQDGLAWDELWVALDPWRPAGNGALLPAGPLRRPVSTLREATRLVFLLEAPGETLPDATLAWLGRCAPGAPVLRLRRTLREPLPRVPLAAITGVGAPARVERFLRAAGADLRLHEAYPDHARWSADALTASIDRARRLGAEGIVITEKDEPRWPPDLAAALPVRVLRTGVEPVAEAAAIG